MSFHLRIKANKLSASLKMASATNASIKPFVSIGVSIRTHSKLQKCSLGEYPRVAKFLDEVERLTVNQDVTGSSPVTGATKIP